MSLLFHVSIWFHCYLGVVSRRSRIQKGLLWSYNMKWDINQSIGFHKLIAVWIRQCISKRRFSLGFSISSNQMCTGVLLNSSDLIIALFKNIWFTESVSFHVLVLKYSFLLERRACAVANTYNVLHHFFFSLSPVLLSFL